MAIDSRVAHGVAGQHLDGASRAALEVLQRLRDSGAKRPSRPATFKGARRELRELRATVARHSLWWTEGEDRHDGPYLAWFGASRDDEELVLYRLRLAPAASRSLPVEMEDVGRLSLHAVARCLQRNGTLAWADVKPLVADATAMFIVMAEVAATMSLRQIALPAGKGVFVGTFAPGDESRMETFLIVYEAVPSRWIAVRKALVEAMGALDFHAAAAASRRTAEWTKRIERICQSLASFWWLREDYDPRLDPVSAAWKDYKRVA